MSRLPQSGRCFMLRKCDLFRLASGSTPSRQSLRFVTKVLFFLVPTRRPSWVLARAIMNLKGKFVSLCWNGVGTSPGKASVFRLHLYIYGFCHFKNFCSVRRQEKKCSSTHVPRSKPNVECVTCCLELPGAGMCFAFQVPRASRSV